MARRPPAQSRAAWGPALRGRLAFCGFAASLALCRAAGASGETPPAVVKPTEEVVNLPLEQLMDIQVTTAARVPEKPAPLLTHEAVMQTPAAVYVITQEDIRRSGFTSIPEVLRLAPGLGVARINSSQWAISARGFNSVLANKLLVLIDGRSVYDPAFSGTFWDIQDTLLEDVDRIEVIRGPGATLWGPNAVNGVINIITSSARETKGGLVAAGVGTQERVFAGARYGAELASNLFLRGFAKYFKRDAQDLPDGADAFDGWSGGRGGFRLDWDASSGDRLTIVGEGYANRNGAQGEELQFTPPFVQFRQGHTFVFGTNLMARWNRVFSDRSDMKVQLYYDYTDRDAFMVLHLHRHTIDLDYQQRTALIARNVITWGAGYRLYLDRTQPGRATFVPANRAMNLFSLFVMDDISLVYNRLRFLAGTKLAHNVFTGFEVQPSARLLWTPGTRHTLWASFSRAVREPSRVENDSITDLAVQPSPQPGAPAVLVRTLGNPDARAESLLAYELGYRVRPHALLSVDVAAFYGSYGNLTSFIPGEVFAEPVPPPVHLVAPQIASNNGSGRTAGAEVALNAQPVGPWRLAASYSYLYVSLRDLNAPFQAAKNSPQHQASLRSQLDLPYRLELDGMLRYVSALAGVPQYIEADIRLGWRPHARVQASLTGQNLIHAHHPEFAFQSATEVPRSVYFRLELRI